MKKFKKIITLMVAAALLTLYPHSNALTASAAEPTTYYLKYHVVNDDTGGREWRMQIGQWLDDYEGRELYYLNEGSEKVKDGDVIVVLEEERTDEQIEKENEEFAKGGSYVPPLHESVKVNARLSNLTVSRNARIVISANGIDNFYAIGSESTRSFSSVSGDVTNAYVYDYSSTTFNNNVTNLHLISSETGKNRPHTYVTVGGTVGYVSVANTAGVYNEWWNFKAGTFDFDKNSGLMTKPENYSTNGTTPTDTTQPNTDTQPQADNNQAANNKPASSGEYDDVPKTGENNHLVIWLFAASALCLAGSLVMRKATNK